MSSLDERGESLMELVITILIMGIGLVAVVGMMGGSIIASDAHRGMAAGEVVIRDFGELIKQKAADRMVRATPADPYVPCPSMAALDPIPVGDAVDAALVGTGWHAEILDVRYWIPDPDSSNFPAGTWSDQTDCELAFTTCGLDLGSCDPGAQRVEFEVWNDRSDYAETRVAARVVVRKDNEQ